MLKAIEPIRAENVVLGQYLGSEDGTQPGYKDGERFLYWNINPYVRRVSFPGEGV